MSSRGSKSTSNGRVTRSQTKESGQVGGDNDLVGDNNGGKGGGDDDVVLVDDTTKTLPGQGNETQQTNLLLPPAADLIPTIQVHKALSDISCTSSQRSMQRRAKLQLMRLEEERAYEKRQTVLRRIAEQQEAEKHKAYLDKKYNLLEDMGSERSNSRASGVGSRVSDWVDQTDWINVSNCEEQESMPPLLPINNGQFPPGGPQQQQNNSNRQQFDSPLDLRQGPNANIRDTERLPTSFNQQPTPRILPDPRGSLPPDFIETRRNPYQLLVNSTTLGGHLPVNSTAHPGHDMDQRPLPRILPNPRADLPPDFIEERRNPFLLPVNPTALEDRRPVNSTAHPGHEINPRHSMNPELENDFSDPFQLSRSQVAARQAVSRDLPTFSGNPEDWPIFLSTFNSTTAMCGFTEEENIVRLQKSLKGKAYEAVKCRLMHPGNVSGILSTLKMMFGQPEVIIHSLIEKICALPSIREDKLETLVDFAVNVQNFCSTVDMCGLPEYMYNVTLLHQLVGKLPPSMKLSWAQHRHTLRSANLTNFGSWVYSLAEAASSVVFPSSHQPRGESRGAKKGSNYLNAHSETPAKGEGKFNPSKDSVKPQKPLATEDCPICKSSCKSADKCKRFLDLSRDSRWAAVREFGLCRSCLRRHKGTCNAKPCGKSGCSWRHHELLHNDQKDKPQSNSKPDPQPPQSEPSSSGQGCNVHQSTSSSVLFRYLPIIMHGKKGVVHTYAFLDEGSALTLLDQDLADELELEGPPNPLCLRWTGGTKRFEKNSRTVNLHVSGVKNEEKKFLLKDVRTVDELLLPSQTLDLDELANLYPHLRGLPIDSYHDARPRILIGMKHAQLSLVRKSREGDADQPFAVKTSLGWTVCGGWSSEASNLFHYTFHVCECNEWSDDNLHQAVKEYFSLDSLGVSKPNKLLLSSEDQRASSLLESLTHLEGNRYKTGLLWRYDDVRLPDSRGMAMRRYHCLEKRLANNPELDQVLNQKISDYASKGYIRKLSSAEIDQRSPRTWYLPVFTVINPNKPGKVRLVWDAAATAFGRSLNSALLKGPDQTCSLFKILLQFRERRYGLTGDIREMFHQVLIREEDQQSQRFFWKEPNGEIGVYVMRVMTFGACCSPSSAQFVKNINADRFKSEFPAAFNAITKSHYVDDMLVSVDTEEEAIQLARDVKNVHGQGGFEIRNWTSNSKSVLAALQESDTGEKNLDLSSELSTEKVLGMWWNTNADVFTFKVGWDRYDRDLLEGRRRPTKREALRVLMSIFDPIGLIAHFLSYLKILLQEIWRAGTQWDEAINDEAFEKWQTWLKVLPQVENVRIPRCYSNGSVVGEAEDVQLHTFADASENGTAAVVFLRIVHAGSVECSIVASKTRVAPIKFTSIPRLELEAAVIGARLAHSVGESLTFRITKRFFWSDSRNVVCWLNADHRRYTQFVAHRVSEILESTDVNEWRWIPSKQNVADDATKWTGLPDLSAESRWFRGPDFLRSGEEAWPQSPGLNNSTDSELRPCFVALHTAYEPAINVEDYSSWPRLVRTVAYARRYVTNLRFKYLKQPIITAPLKSEELRAAENYLLRQAQREGYPDEVATLENAHCSPQPTQKTVPRTSSIYQLTPWMDDDGVMRMRTRISACRYASDDAKNPIILPRYHHTTTLIVQQYHEKYHHLNQETVVNELRQRFRIPRLRVCLQQVRRQCQRCKNDRTTPQPPMMADLPPARLDAFTLPFTHTGVDYFGPIEVVLGKRVEKRWVMLATCLTVRGIYTEIVHSLSTSSCIMALRSFISRHGTPRKIYSDRGTNFIGANRELRETAKAFNEEDLAKEFTTAETEWIFNPPMSPHMGGAWERLIRTIKNNMLAVCSMKKLTDEVLRSLLVEIENIVNSRPLTHVPVDDDSAPALTPNHFLLGSSNGSKPLTTLDDTGYALKQNWRTSQILANLYWKRWVTDYLPEITRRTKWFQHTPPIAVGDIVVIVDPKIPRNCWPKGRIIYTRISNDGRIRSATVQTASGVYERPTSKLAVLDVRRD